MDISVSKADVIWSYLAQFFNIGAGFITLPLVLHMLSTEEIAMNYLMLTIGTMVALIDFGFAPQFGRNVTYVFSGAVVLEKEGLHEGTGNNVNYHLLKCLIDVAKKVYFYMSIIVLIVMMTAGTWYIYTVTDGFTKVENSFFIWCVYTLSTFFNIYFYYYSSLLTGRGQIKESKKAFMLSKITNIILTYVLLFCGLGLMGVCIANLISPFVIRWYSYRTFYDKEIRYALNLEKSTNAERKHLFTIIWYNAKKLGINFIGAYAILKFSMFIAGLYLSLKDISSYGLMNQLVAILSGVSMTFMNTLLPKISSIRVRNNKNELIRNFAWGMNIYYLIFISGAFILVIAGPFALKFIGSNAELPSISILILFLFITLLENNHGQFATFIATGNNIPFVNAAIISGLLICFGDFGVLQFTSLGLMGIVLIQGIIQLAYNNWYWPRYALRELNISFPFFFCIGFEETWSKAKKWIQI